MATPSQKAALTALLNAHSRISSMFTTGYVDGTDLRLVRVVRDIRATELARRYGASRQRITLIEAKPQVTARTASKYLAALDQPS